MYTAAVQATIANLSDDYYETVKAPEPDPPIIETLSSGDLLLTCLFPGATVQYIIDKINGEFIATHRERWEENT